MLAIRQCVGIALCLSLAGLARAQELPPEARRHFDRGVELADAEDYEHALAELEAAAAIRETAGAVYNVASCLRALGRRAQALAAFERARELGAESLPAASRANLDRYVAELQPFVALLTVRTNVPDAELTIDGRPSARQPHPLDPGTEATVVARRATYREARAVARPQSPGPFELSLTLESEPHDLPLREPPSAGGPPGWSPWVAFGVAVAAAGAGAFFGSRVLDVDRSESEADTSATGATVSFSVAGAAAASGLGLLIWRQTAAEGGESR